MTYEKTFIFHIYAFGDGTVSLKQYCPKMIMKGKQFSLIRGSSAGELDRGALWYHRGHNNFFWQVLCFAMNPVFLISSGSYSSLYSYSA